jgi:ubiquinone/menaquinone biosynthesis C-methylase UbiE
MNLHDQMIHDYFDWDVKVWSQALGLWNKFLMPSIDSLHKAIEIAANRGGLCLYLAKKGYHVICSDIYNPQERAEELHKKYKLFHIEYMAVNALNTSFPNNHFDVVLFKSFLGRLSTQQQQTAIRELHRILKPGGKLLFAENLKGSWFHQFARKKFVSWGKDWNYISIEEIKKLMEVFTSFHYGTSGFISLYFPNIIFKRLIFPIDNVFCKIIPQHLQYVIYGVSIK